MTNGDLICQDRLGQTFLIVFVPSMSWQISKVGAENTFAVLSYYAIRTGRVAIALALKLHDIRMLAEDILVVRIQQPRRAGERDETAPASTSASDSTRTDGVAAWWWWW